jgi:hypothetical protein
MMMVDTRLQECDAVLIGLSWTAETLTVGGHKHFCYVSETVTTVHISVKSNTVTGLNWPRGWIEV